MLFYYVYSELRFSKLTESVWSFALLSQFFVSGLVICTCAYQLTTVDPSDVSKFMFIVIYTICVLIEIFVPSVFGTILFENSSKLSYSAFQSNWLTQKKCFKQMMMIFAERSKQPILIRGGEVFFLGLTTLLKVKYLGTNLKFE